MKLTWYEGARHGKRHLPSPDLFQGKVPTDSGSLMVGKKGSIFSSSDDGTDQVLLGASESGAKPKVSTEARPKNDGDANHKAEWVRAIREGNPSIALSNFAYSGVLTEAMLLGNVAVRLGKLIDYDAATGLVTNAPRRPGLSAPSTARAGHFRVKVTDRGSSRPIPDRLHPRGEGDVARDGSHRRNLR